MIIGYQGEIGCYTYASIKKFLYNKYNKLVNFISFEDIFNALKNNKITHGFIPIENTIGGKINENELLLKNNNNINIIEKYKFKINHCLLANKNVKRENLKDIYSHWQALKQCSDYLINNDFNGISYYDTAGSCKYIFDENKQDIGAIASKECSKIYNLEIIEENIQNNDKNYTTFYLIELKKNIL